MMALMSAKSVRVNMRSREREFSGSESEIDGSEFSCPEGEDGRDLAVVTQASSPASSSLL
jgi:hypothetical protein